MTLRDVLARAMSQHRWGWLSWTDLASAGDQDRVRRAFTNVADTVLQDPALAAAERVLAAADQWDQTDSIRDRKRLSEAVGDFRAYRSAVEEK